MASPLKKGDVRLSYSSMNLLNSCTQKYYHYKIANTPPDADAEEMDTSVFDIGTAFHYVLEMSEHVFNEDTLMKHLTNQAELFDFTEEQKAMVHGMLLKYHKLNIESGLKCIHAELELSSSTFFGLVDVIMVDPEGYWWIVDLKTAARLQPLTVARLNRDMQLNLYAAFAEGIAGHLELDEKKFLGCRYRVTTKPKLKRKKTESYAAFVKRNYKSCTSYDIAIPIADMNPKQAVELHHNKYEQANRLRSGEEKPIKNFASCDSYFRACAYWSQCCGRTHTESVEAMKDNTWIKE